MKEKERGALITNSGKCSTCLLIHQPFVICNSFTKVAVVRQWMETAAISRSRTLVLHIMTALLLDGIGNGAV